MEMLYWRPGVVAPNKSKKNEISKIFFNDFHAGWAILEEKKKTTIHFGEIFRGAPLGFASVVNAFICIHFILG